MDIITIWDSLGWVDGILFSVWVSVMYYIKAWIDNRFPGTK